MRDTIVEQLIARAGLTKEQAEKAADVVMEIIEAKTGGLKDKLGSIPGAGSLF